MLLLGEIVIPGIEKIEKEPLYFTKRSLQCIFCLVGMPFRQKPPEKVGVIWGQIKPKAFILSGTLSS